MLLGAGATHLQLLRLLARKPVAGAQWTLVSGAADSFDGDRLADFVAGERSMAQCLTDLEPLLRHSGVRWLPMAAVGLDANARTLRLRDGSALTYDWLSVDCAAVQERERMAHSLPGAREHALFVQPAEVFANLWVKVRALDPGRLRSVAVVGDSIAAAELALAIRSCLPQAAISLVVGAAEPLAQHPPAFRRLAAAALQRRGITVLRDSATGVRAGELLLGCGARLACDVPVIAEGAAPPSWLASSGLALDPAGAIRVDAFGRSTSHPDLFASTGQSSAASALAANLAALISGGSALQPMPLRRGPVFLSCFDGSAIACWGPVCAAGRLPHWLRQRLVA